jgi:hypothetical protein
MCKPLNNLYKWVIAGLLAFVGCQYAMADSVTGRWSHDHHSTSISKGPGSKLQFCNEQGSCAEGFYRGKNFVFVPKWNVTGSINPHTNVIAWSNGSQWVRHSLHRPQQNELRVHVGQSSGSVGGSWLHEGRPTTIQMQPDGVHFTLINEYGERSVGFMRGRKDLVLPQLQVKGRLHKHGRVISWTNNTTWYRP